MNAEPYDILLIMENDDILSALCAMFEAEVYRNQHGDDVASKRFFNDAMMRTIQSLNHHSPKLREYVDTILKNGFPKSEDQNNIGIYKNNLPI